MKISYYNDPELLTVDVLIIYVILYAHTTYKRRLLCNIEINVTHIYQKPKMDQPLNAREENNIEELWVNELSIL